jgi:pyruvyltransferase
MKTFYWGDVPQNFGDVLTANILNHYGIEFKHTNNQYEGKYFATGSIIRLAKNGATILGSGCIRENEDLDRSNIYRFVRGPITRDRVLECGGECPEIYGDPALLLPRFCPPSEKQHKVGFIPHYSHRNKYTKQLAKTNGWYYIDLVDDDPLVPARKISSCETVMSTSLHGIIAAHAYGIPAAHVTTSNTCQLWGDGTKFLDYYASVGLTHKLYGTDNPRFEVGNLPDLDIIEGIFKEYV